MDIYLSLLIDYIFIVQLLQSRENIPSYRTFVIGGFLGLPCFAMMDIFDTIKQKKAVVMAKRKLHATIIDVAKEANVSIGTVSRYINDLPVRAYNVEPIKNAIEKLDFKPSETARLMKNTHSKMIGMLLSGYDQFHIAILHKIAEVLEKAGYTLLTYHVDPFSDDYVKAVNFFAKRKFDGLILSGNIHSKTALAQTINTFKSIVVFNNEIPSLEMDRVVTDNEEACRRCVEYLIAKNHREIGIILGSQLDSSGVDRYAGYLAALQNHAIPVNEQYIIQGEWTIQSGYAGGKRIAALKNRPTAVICSNYLQTIGFMQAAHEHGLLLPEDVSLISFDDIESFKITKPSITAIVQPSEEIGSYVAQYLLDRIEGRYKEKGRVMKLPARIIERESVRKL